MTEKENRVPELTPDSEGKVLPEPRQGEDPHGYAIRYAEDGDGFVVIRQADDEVIAETATRDEAIAAALADRAH